MQGTQAWRTLTGLALPRAHDDCRHRRGKVVHAGALALQAKHAVDPAIRRRGRRRAEVKEPQDTAVENADLYRAADNADHAIASIDSAMQSNLYWCIAECKRAFLHSNGTFRQVRMDAAPVPRRILQQIRLAMCPPISHFGRRSKPVQYCPHGTRNANVPVAPVDQGTSADDQLRPYERGE